MGDMGEYWNAHKDHVREQRERRDNANLNDFAAASALLEGWPLKLKECGYGHYQIVSYDGWIVNLWPRTQKIHHAGNGRGPFLELPRGKDWSLSDAVKAAIKAEAGGAGND